MWIFPSSRGLFKVWERFIVLSAVYGLLPLVHPIPLCLLGSDTGVSRLGWTCIVRTALSVNRITGREGSRAGDNGRRGRGTR